MAKKKKRKTEDKVKHGFELTGLLWILIAVIGFGGEDIFGPVVKVISNFSVFLNGSLFGNSKIIPSYDSYTSSSFGISFTFCSSSTNTLSNG